MYRSVVNNGWNKTRRIGVIETFDYFIIGFATAFRIMQSIDKFTEIFFLCFVY